MKLTPYFQSVPQKTKKNCSKTIEKNCVESSCTTARKEFENCVELDIFVFSCFLHTLHKIIKLKATIYTFFRLNICVLD